MGNEALVGKPGASAPVMSQNEQAQSKIHFTGSEAASHISLPPLPSSFSSSLVTMRVTAAPDHPLRGRCLFSGNDNLLSLPAAFHSLHTHTHMHAHTWHIWIITADKATSLFLFTSQLVDSTDKSCPRVCEQSRALSTYTLADECVFFLLPSCIITVLYCNCSRFN